MNTIEERIRAAARAAADTVPPDSVPPLELPAGREARFRWRRPGSPEVSRAGWLAPAAAATVMVVLAVSVLLASRATHEAAVAPSPAASASGAPEPGPPIASYVASGQVPPYYLAITSHGNPNFNPSYAVVRATASGKTLGTIEPPAPGGTIVAVTAAADDRTFVFSEQPRSSDQTFEPHAFYLVRLDSAGRPAPVTKLGMSVPRGQLVTGLALSPDARQLAIAVEPDNVQSDPNLQQVRLYTLATGAVRTWSADGTIGSGPDDARSMSWANDEQTLAFDWIGPNSGTMVVRLLDLGAPGGDLLADSRLATTLSSPEQGKAQVPTPTAPATGPATALFPTISVPRVTATPAQPALACQEDSVVTPDGSAVVCGAIEAIDQKTNRTANGVISLKRGAETGFFEFSTATGKVTHILGRWTFANVGALSMNVLWSNASGSLLIAVIPTAGDGRIGVIRGNEFTPILAQSAGVSADSGIW